MHVFITVILQNPSAIDSAKLNSHMLSKYQNYNLCLSPPKFTLDILKMAKYSKYMAVTLNKSILKKKKGHYVSSIIHSHVCLLFSWL